MLIFLYYFSNDKSIPLQILHHFPLSLHITPLQCFSSYINILWIKGTHQSPIFETFQCLHENSLSPSYHIISFLQQQVGSSSNFASLFSEMTHNSSVIFQLILYTLWIYVFHQNANFKTFVCWHENLPIFSCHFCNNR